MIEVRIKDTTFFRAFLMNYPSDRLSLKIHLIGTREELDRLLRLVELECSKEEIKREA